jgi:hypothetical protein
MKLILYSVTFVIISALAVACSTPLSVTSDYDKSADFQRYKTFAFRQAPSDKQSVSQLNQDRITNAIRSEMMNKGFQENIAEPELIIHVATILKNKQSVTATTNYYGYGSVYRPYYWNGINSASFTTYDIHNYKDGSLIIEIINARTEKLLWEGIGNKEIDGPVAEPDKAIQAAVTTIMKSFPPPGIAVK